MPLFPRLCNRRPPFKGPRLVNAVYDSVGAEPASGSTFPDAPRPVSRVVAVESQPWVASGFLGLLNDVGAKIFRAPLFVPYFTRPSFQHLVIANVLLTTLAATAAPFTPANATQLYPVRRVVQVQQQDIQNLIPITAQPFAQEDWPNPVLLVTAREFGFTAGQPFNTPNVKPFFQTDQPNPTLRTLTREWGFTASQLFNTPDPLIVKPFLQSEWPNPLLRVRGIYPFSHRPAGVPDTTKPFLQSEWPVPRGKPFPLLQGYVCGYEVFPFAQMDWPNPVNRKVSFPHPATWPSLSILTAPAPPVVPEPEIAVQGGGGGGRWKDEYGGGKKKKWRDRQKELFDAIEASIREQLYPPEIAPDEPAPVVKVPQEDWTKLKQYAADNAVLSARLTALKQDLDRYEAEQQALRDDEDDFWIMV